MTAMAELLSVKRTSPPRKESHAPKLGQSLLFFGILICSESPRAGRFNDFHSTSVLHSSVSRSIVGYL